MTKSKQPPRGAKTGAAKSSVQTAAQKRLAAQRAMALANGAAAARRKRLYAILSPIAVVVLVAIVLVVVKVNTADKAPNVATTATGNVASDVTSVPASVLDSIGAGSSSAPPTALTGAALSAGGLPRVLYVGAEWCPYCAAERWPLAVALSRFGTLTGLGQTASSPNDTDPSTPTLTFHGATFVSSVISFSGIEVQDGARQPLDKLDAADSALFQSVGQGGFPFLDIGGKYLINGAQYNPGLLSGMTQKQIAADLHSASSPVAKSIDGAANVITAAICAVNGNQPAKVCSAAGVVAAAKNLP
ncbi:MAG: DUF929 family protein [Jatrophihabitantaceae bacterium]